MTIRSIMTLAGEKRADTFKTRQFLQTTEMRILRRIGKEIGKTLKYREMNENIRRACETENINEWAKGRKVQ